MEARPEDCVGYCVLNLDDVFKSVFAGREESRKTATVELCYALRHPDPTTDATLARTQSKVVVTVQFKCLRDEPVVGGGDGGKENTEEVGETAAVQEMPLSSVDCSFLRSITTAQELSDAVLARGPRISFR
jgi:hypothetical protein